MTAPALAVVTVTYSPGDHLRRFLDSLEAAAVGGAAVILADNGSVDGVPQAVAEERESVHFLDTGANLGYGGGMNAGVRKARQLRDAGLVRADYLLITNPDVTFSAGALDALVACAEAWPGVGAVGPKIVEPDGSIYPSARTVPSVRNGIGHALFAQLWPSNPWTRAYRDDADMSEVRRAGWLSGSCLLVRWDAFDAIGGFDERYFMYLEDIDFGDRLARAGFDNVYCPDAVIVHAQGHSTSAYSERMLLAHHDSAYRFQADRHPAWWQAPLRAALRLGLKARAQIAVAHDNRSADSSMS